MAVLSSRCFSLKFVVILVPLLFPLLFAHPAKAVKAAAEAEVGDEVPVPVSICDGNSTGVPRTDSEAQIAQRSSTRSSTNVPPTEQPGATGTILNGAIIVTVYN